MTLVSMLEIMRRPKVLDDNTYTPIIGNLPGSETTYGDIVDLIGSISYGLKIRHASGEIERSEYISANSVIKQIINLYNLKNPGIVSTNNRLGVDSKGLYDSIDAGLSELAGGTTMGGTLRNELIRIVIGIYERNGIAEFEYGNDNVPTRITKWNPQSEKLLGGVHMGDKKYSDKEKDHIIDKVSIDDGMYSRFSVNSGGLI
jgi:hypothetical protein